MPNPAILRLRESHKQPIYAIAFNQVDASLVGVFAAVGANRATVYQLADDGDDGDDEASAAASAGDKRVRRRVTPRELLTLQAYRDEDDDECFYCCAWGLEKAPPPPPGGSSLSASAGAVGSLLAVGGSTRQIKLIDCCSGNVRAVLRGHGGAINEIRFHPTKHALLLSASADETVRLWHVGSGACLASFVGDEGHRDAVVSIDFKHDGTCFASGSIDGTVKVWSLEALRKLGERVEEAEEVQRQLLAAATAKAQAEAHGEAQADGALRLGAGAGSAAAAEQGEEGEPATADGGRGPVRCPEVAACPEAQHRAVGPPPLLCQFPVATYEKVHYDAGTQLSYWVDCVRYVGHMLLTRGSDGRALMWDPRTATRVVRPPSDFREEAWVHERSPHLMPSDSLAFRIGGTAGIWYLRFALDPLKRRCAPV